MQQVVQFCCKEFFKFVLWLSDLVFKMSSNRTSKLCASADMCWCTGIKTHKVTYVWAIQNFTFLEAVGNELTSSTFSAVDDDETKWYLTLDPNGENEAKDFISLYLCLSDDSKHKKAFAKLSSYVLNKNLDEVHICIVEQVDEYTVNSAEIWGYAEFLHKGGVFQDNFLIDDTLTIKFIIDYSTSDAIDSAPRDCNHVRLYPDTPECNLSQQFGLLLENQDLADVVLSVNGKKHPAHKLVLAARSPVFAAMFRHNTKENEENHVYIENMDEKVVGEMLRYIYTGKCEKLPELAADLLAAADKYNLVHLKMICAEEMYKNLSVENAASILALADMYGVKELKNAVIKFIVCKPEVVNTDGWKSIRSNFELADEVCLAIARR